MAASRRAIELSLGDVAVERLRPGTPTSVFLAERLELPAAAGTDVALAVRKLRLRGQLRSGFGLCRRDGQRRSRDHDRRESYHGPSCNGKRHQLESAPVSGGRILISSSSRDY
jgi:hypothetical protein